MKRICIAVFMIAASMVMLLTFDINAQNIPETDKQTLYHRLGGYDAIAAFVDLAFPRVGSHPKLAHLFGGHSRESQFRQRQLIVDMLCKATGGPCVYIGREMKSVHTGLGISDEQWSVFIKIIEAAMTERKFPASEKQAFLEIFEHTFRPDVVENEVAKKE